jgi:hypothetical protein
MAKGKKHDEVNKASEEIKETEITGTKEADETKPETAGVKTDQGDVILGTVLFILGTVLFVLNLFKLF